MLIFKYGIWPGMLILILILLITAVLAAAAGRWQFNNQIDAELENLKSFNNSAEEDYEDEVISASDLEALPIPVENWLKKLGLVGSKKIRAVELKQSGLMKLDPEQKQWYKPEAEQYICVKQPGYLWQVDLDMLPLVNTKGRDLFLRGEASMLFKIASLIPVVNQDANEKINESALHRFLLELPWYPTAALNDYISWEEIDENTARATINYQESSASAEFEFDDDFNLLSTEAVRYKDSGEDAERKKCVGEIKEYIIEDGLKVPAEIDVSWYLDEGKFTWFKLEVKDISFKY